MNRMNDHHIGCVCDHPCCSVSTSEINQCSNCKRFICAQHFGEHICYSSVESTVTAAPFNTVHAQKQLGAEVFQQIANFGDWYRNQADDKWRRNYVSAQAAKANKQKELTIGNVDIFKLIQLLDGRVNSKAARLPYKIVNELTKSLCAAISNYKICENVRRFPYYHSFVLPTIEAIAENFFKFRIFRGSNSVVQDLTADELDDLVLDHQQHLEAVHASGKPTLALRLLIADILQHTTELAWNESRQNGAVSVSEQWRCLLKYSWSELNNQVRPSVTRLRSSYSSQSRSFFSLKAT